MAHPDVDTDARDDDGKTVLHVAADISSLDIVATLVESGKFDIEARSIPDQRTALHWAAGFENDDPSHEKAHCLGIVYENSRYNALSF